MKLNIVSVAMEEIKSENDLIELLKCNEIDTHDVIGLDVDYSSPKFKFLHIDSLTGNIIGYASDDSVTFVTTFTKQLDEMKPATFNRKVEKPILSMGVDEKALLLERKKEKSLRKLNSFDTERLERELEMATKFENWDRAIIIRDIINKRKNG